MKNGILRLLSLTGLALAMGCHTGWAQLKVKTNPFIARGSTEALARCTVTGVAATNVQEFGICWSTNDTPTIEDNRTTKRFTQSGYIYHIEGLTPSTVYYMRGYAQLKDGSVGYGDIVKVITIPAGKITWSYNNGGPADANQRINAAVKDAVEYLNTFTSIKGFHTTVNYGAQTQTADCSYGGWMRVGPNASYQRTGTILHELLHGIGVGTHWVWQNNASLRANTTNGYWLGDRVTEVVRFLDNSSTAYLNGDGTHMWPYGINGAHEDTGQELLYIGCALIAQALGEDGLPPTGGFCTPAYCLNQEDNIKYYIKNEDPNGGLYTSYLMENKIGNLVWKEMTAADATGNDSCAWYVTFTPDNCYYQIRNAATGKYVTYKRTGANGIGTIAKETPAVAEDFHLMRSRADVTIGEGNSALKLRGYWIIHPENKDNPQCLTISTLAGMTSTAAYNMADNATKQRWIFLQADELQQLEDAARITMKGEISDIAERLKGLAATPHVETTAGADATFNAFIASLETMDDASLNELTALIEQADKATIQFLEGVKVTDTDQPFDLTYLVDNAAIDNNEGWSVQPTVNHSCGEFYQKAFDMYQTLTDMPAGTYDWCVQAFQRPGASTASYNDYLAGKNLVMASLYAGTKSEKIKHIATDAQKAKIHSSDVLVGETYYIPNTMQGTSLYFAKGLYENKITVEQANKGNLKLGLRNTSASSNFWTIFDNFRLYYYGDMNKEEVNGINRPTLDGANGNLFATPTDIYNIVGIRVKSQAKSLEGLTRGIYIVNGRKVIVK